LIEGKRPIIAGRLKLDAELVNQIVRERRNGRFDQEIWQLIDEILIGARKTASRPGNAWLFETTPGQTGRRDQSILGIIGHKSPEAVVDDNRVVGEHGLFPWL
jgi:hypothetical protein